MTSTQIGTGVTLCSKHISLRKVPRNQIQWSRWDYLSPILENFWSRSLWPTPHGTFVRSSSQIFCIQSLAWWLSRTVIFETLKSKDYDYWSGLKNKEGLSYFSVCSEFVKDAVCILYLIDKDAQYMIIGLTAVSMCLSGWKVLKMTPIEKKEDGSFPFYRIVFDKTYADQTSSMEKDAVRYVSYLLVPCMFIYVVRLSAQ